MSKSRIPRRAPHNVLVNLPADQLEQLVRWLVTDNLTYHETAGLLLEQFQVSVSHESVHQFFKRFCAPELAKRDEAIRRLVQKHWEERLPQIVSK